MQNEDFCWPEEKEKKAARKRDHLFDEKSFGSVNETTLIHSFIHDESDPKFEPTYPTERKIHFDYNYAKDWWDL